MVPAVIAGTAMFVRRGRDGLVVGVDLDIGSLATLAGGPRAMARAGRIWQVSMRLTDLAQLVSGQGHDAARRNRQGNSATRVPISVWGIRGGRLVAAGHLVGRNVDELISACGSALPRSVSPSPRR